MAEEKKIHESAAGGAYEEGAGSRFIPGERREGLDAVRRSGEERRQASDPAPETDSPEEKQRRREFDRRDQEERRGVTFDVVCKTSGTLSSIEDWLDDNCKGDWELVLLSLGKGFPRKGIKVIFSLFADKVQFIENYGSDE